MADTKDILNFRVDRVNKIKSMYADEMSRKRRQDESPNYNTINYVNAAAVRSAMLSAISNREQVVEASKRLYVINPIYSAIINYMRDMFMWRYKVIPHKVYSKSKAKARKAINEEDFGMMYNLMLEVVDGLNIENKFPEILTQLYIQGSVYFTTFCDEDSLTINTIILPDKFCRRINETQFGTSVIEFDFSYFESLGLNNSELNDFFKGFPKEFKSCYNRYAKDSNMRWQALDPFFSSCLMQNELGIPTFFYLEGSILNFEQYQDNELERSDNLLKYIVVQKMPVYQDKLIFEMDEVAALHKSLRRIVDVGDKARLITTFGDVHVDRISDNDTSENQVLSKAFKSIFNNAGFNSGIFTDDSVTALKMSLVRDKGAVWNYIQQLVNFYNLTVNN